MTHCQQSSARKQTKRGAFQESAALLRREHLSFDESEGGKDGESMSRSRLEVKTQQKAQWRSYLVAPLRWLTMLLLHLPLIVFDSVGWEMKPLWSAEVHMRFILPSELVPGMSQTNRQGQGPMRNQGWWILCLLNAPVAITAQRHTNIKEGICSPLNTDLLAVSVITKSSCGAKQIPQKCQWTSKGLQRCQICQAEF